jgi:hypothetical protein
MIVKNKYLFELLAVHLKDSGGTSSGGRYYRVLI